MSKLHARRAPVNHALPLFEWAELRHRAAARITPAAAWLRARHPLSPARAALVAELAGLGGADGR